MDKITEFLVNLEEELRYLKPKDLEQVLKFYRDKINIQQDYGETPEKIIASLPSPKYIAKEVYESKGKEFLNNRKKQIRKNQVVKAVFSSIVLLIIIGTMIAIYAYLGFAVVQLIKFLAKLGSLSAFLDILTIAIFTMIYMILVLVLMIYLFDLGFIIASHFLLIVLDAINKKEIEYKFLNFTISGFFEKIFKKKKVLFKIFIGLIISFILFGVGNFFIEGYIYRSLNDITVNEKKYEVSSDINKIVVENSSAFIKIKVDDDSSRKVRLVIKREFIQDIDYKVEDGVLTVDKINYAQFDAFGLLDEPLPLLEIYIPSYMNVSDIDITLTNGYFDMADISKEFNLAIKGTLSTVALTRNNISSFSIEGYEMTIANEENNIKDVNIVTRSGKYYSVLDIYENLKINTELTQVVLQEVTTVNCEGITKSAQSAFVKCSIDNLSYIDQNSESYFQDTKTNVATVKSVGNSKMTLERIIAYTNVDLLTESGTIEVTFLKAPVIKGTLLRGTLNMYYINKDSLNLDDTNSYIKDYNEYNVIGELEIDAQLANIEITNTDFNKANIKIREGQMKMNALYFKEFDLEDSYANISIQDLDGEKFNASITGGSFTYYNNIETNIVFTYTTSKNPTLEIDEDLKKGE